jgi:hypothetical protein
MENWMNAAATTVMHSTFLQKLYCIYDNHNWQALIRACGARVATWRSRIYSPLFICNLTIDRGTNILEENLYEDLLL